MPRYMRWECTLDNAIQLSRLPTRQAPEAFITSKCEFLMHIGLWPLSHTLDPRGWLRNFDESERPYALNLLNVFLYFNENLMNALLRSAVQQLTLHVTTQSSTLNDARKEWNKFHRNVLVTYIESENPSATDSGRVFARRARQVLGIEEQQIGSPVETLTKLAENYPGPVLLLDDFIGSGNQMVNTWRHRYCLGSSEQYSFEMASDCGRSIFCVPLIATTLGVDALARRCNGLRVVPAHILDGRYSLVATDSILWPDELKSTSKEFLYSASERAGILAESGVQWEGFHGLGLGLAFSDSVPDATIPLYYWERPGWNALIRRS